MSTPAVLLLVLLMNCLVTSAVLGSLLSAGVPGLRRWLAAQALLAVAVGAMLAAGALPVTVAVASALYACATLAVLQGFRQFFGVTPVHRAELVAAALLFAALAYGARGRPDPNLRVVLVSGFGAYIRLAIAWLAWRRRPANRPVYAYLFVAAIALVGALVHIARGVASALGRIGDPSLLSTTPMSVAFLTLGVLSLLCLSMGVVMLAHDRMAERLERLATVDGLTGALMRSAFIDRAERLHRRAARSGALLSLVIVDLDNFKAINDRYGHAAGDLALVHFAATVSCGIRRCDLFGRLGGEEFAVLCPDLAADEAKHAIEQLRVSLAAGTGPAARDVVGFTFSAGVAEHVADEPLSQLMARADAALYTAKATGRDRVVVAAPAHCAGIAA